MREAWVISDLHLGDGVRPGLEDFSDDELLAEWIAKRSNDDTCVVINGDFVDFLQIPVEVTPKNLPKDRLWDQPTSVRKLEASFKGHQKVFDALQGFVKAGGDLRFTIGNHDLDFVWPDVQMAVRQRLGDNDNRIQFALQHTLFDHVHVEHGHRFTGENCPLDFTDFRHTYSQQGQPDVAVLECTWGSRFVLDALNPLEAEHPYIDNVKPTWKLAFHMLKEGGWFKEGRGHALLELLRFFRRAGIPLRDIADAALSEEQPITPANLENVFGPDEGAWRKLIAQIRRESGSELQKAFAELSDEERAELQAKRRIEIGEPEKLDQRASDQIDHEERDTAVGDLGLFRKSREVRGALDCLGQKGISHIVLGHTHEVVNQGEKGRLFNPGSWIERLKLDSSIPGPLRDTVTRPELFETDPRAVRIVSHDNKATVTLENVTV